MKNELRIVGAQEIGVVTTSNRESAVVNAQGTGSIREMTPNEIDQDVERHLMSTAAIMGFKNTFAGVDGVTLLNQTSQDIRIAIKQFFPNLKRGELALAFTYGRTGLLGEYVGLTPKTVMDWIKQYYKAMREPVMAGIANKNQVIEETSPEAEERIKKENNEISQREIKELYLKSLDEGKSLFRNDSKKLAYYMYLERIGKINLTIDEKKKIFQEEKSRYCQNQKSSGNTKGDFKAFMLHSADNSHTAAVKHNCHRRCFDEYIQGCIDDLVDDPTK